MLDSTTTFNELMFHPLEGSGQTEWVELYNQMSVDMDLSGWQIRGGVEYTFPQGTTLAGGDYAVVAADPTALELATGLSGVFGPLSGNLGNSGETLELYNANDRRMDRLRYSDAGRFPSAPDGSGATLTKIKKHSDSDIPESWTHSPELGGTPGALNFAADDSGPPVEAILSPPNDQVNFFVPTDGSLGSTWTTTTFDDSSWDSGTYGVGFDTDADGVASLQNVALGKSIIANSGTYEFAVGFEATNVVDGSTSDVTTNNTPNSSTYWLGPQGQDQQWFTLDLGEEFNIQEIHLRNTHNSVSNDRGTGNFRILASNAVDQNNDLVNPVEILSDSLTPVWGQSPIVADEFSAANGLTVVDARYLRFETLSSNNMGQHVGLNEIEVFVPVALDIGFVPAPIAYWPFDGDWDDSSGNGANGTPVGTTFSADVPGSLGSGESLSLNGNSQYVSATLDVSETAHTASMWFKTSSNSRGLFAVVDGDLGAGGHDRHIFLNGSNVSTRVWSSETIVSSGLNVSDDQWHHLVHVYGGDVGGQRIYVDGQQVVSGNKSQSDFNWQQRVNIGFSNDAASDYFNGLIDDVAVWDVALNDDAIQALYLGQNPLSIGGIGASIATNVESEVLDTNSSLYLRSTFNAPNNYDRLLLRMKYDDGFVAYLNGTEVARRDVPAIVDWNSLATTNRIDQDALTPTVIDITDHLGLLESVDNVLAIQALNSAVDEHDFFIQPEIIGRVAPLSAADASISINEYSVGVGSSAIEIANFGTSDVSLDDWRILHRQSGIEYVFPATTINAGEYLNLTSAQLGFDLVEGDRVFLYAAGRSAVLDGVRVGANNAGRLTPGTGDFAVVSSSTPATENVFALHDEIVINEIMYHRAPQYADENNSVAYLANDEEWIELYNRSNQVVDLTGWRLDGDIQFDFPDNTMLGADEYLVVSNDANALLNDYPGATVLGDFDGTLRNSGGRILLRDDVDNVADEVNYFDEKPWPQAADGGGASLELQDPFADNDSPEAWAASDESGRTQWNHYTYTGVASPILYDPPINFHEFVMGLVDTGVVLIDNVEVVQTPNSNPIQLLQNGDFEGDAFGGPADKWRIIGTHQLSQVVEDPNNPGNHVLQLEATSRANYLANHAETTLANNATVVNGTEYSISFDAKWVAGSPQLRTELYYNDLARLSILELPTLSGTPGESNSTRVANIGPTYRSLSHFPVVPDATEPVVVSVQAEDPDNVASMSLWYALEGQVWTSVTMTHGGDGVYTGEIPGQSSGAIVQFYVEGNDDLGASSMYPAAGPDSRALVKYQDGGAREDGQNFRITTLTADANDMHERVEILSNFRKGATVVYNENEIFYDVGVRLRGSMFSRSNSGRAGYNVQFNADQLFRGVHDSVTMKTVSKVEILVKHLAVQAGIPGVYDDMVYVMKPANVSNGIAIFSMARHQNLFLDEQFENGSDGTLFKMEGIRVMQRENGSGPEDLKTYHPNIGWVSSFDLNDFGDDKERYRWNIQIGNNRARDDYSRIIDMMQTFALSGSELEERANEVLDVDQWMRTFALMSLAGIGDTYTQGNPHNLNFFVRPEDNKVLALPWDWDFTFSRSTSSPLWGGKNLSNLISRPANQRLFMGHMLDMINTVYNVDYMSEWTESFGNAAGESYAARLNYIQQRGDFVQSRFIPNTPFEITTNNGVDFSTADSQVTLTGNGWIDVREIRLAGDSNPLPVTWTDQDSWVIALPLAVGQNMIQLEAYGFQGELISSDSINVNSTTLEPTLIDSLRITEVMYHPADATPDEVIAGYDADEFEYIEIRNTGNGTLDLENVQITTAVDFTFPDIDLAAGEYIVVVENLNAFELRYGNQINVAGQWSGGLNNSSDTVRLADPAGITITEFTYSDSGNWPERSDGSGSSLEIVDTTGDYTKADNWGPSSDYNGSPGEAGTTGQVSIVVNEVLTHTDLPSVDSVELYNPTGSDIEISGWYLSDARSNYRKYQFPGGTTIASGQYLIVDETDFNASVGVDPNDFAFDGAHGDQVYLLQTDNSDALIRFADEVDFGAAANGESFGRWPNGTGELYPMISQTFGQANSGPRVGPIIISEVMYHPPTPNLPALADDLEFVEIQNSTTSDVDLTNWRIRGGIDYDFADGEILPAGDVLVLVSFDPNVDAALDSQFRQHYEIDGTVQLVGPYSGKLDNGSDRITLQRPDDPPLEEPTFIPRLLEDEVVYDDDAPWVTSPDGSGDSLNRVGDNVWGRDFQNWIGLAPTPGIGAPGTLQVVSLEQNVGFVDPPDLVRGTQPTSWAEQRSSLRNIEIKLNSVGTIALSDLRLTNLGVNADAEVDVDVPLTADQVNITQDSIRISFAANALSNGVYEFAILDSATDWAGMPIDGDGDGTPGGDFIFRGNEDNRFYVLTAEWSGDEGVSVFDFSTFSYWFGQSVGVAPEYVDANGDSGVSVFDFTSFSANFGKGIIYPTTFAALTVPPKSIIANDVFASNEQESAQSRNGLRPIEPVWNLPMERTEPIEFQGIADQEIEDLLDVIVQDVANNLG